MSLYARLYCPLRLIFFESPCKPDTEPKKKLQKE